MNLYEEDRAGQLKNRRMPLFEHYDMRHVCDAYFKRVPNQFSEAKFTGISLEETQINVSSVAKTSKQIYTKRNLKRQVLFVFIKKSNRANNQSFPKTKKKIQKTKDI